jgi:hypothetical protein
LLLAGCCREESSTPFTVSVSKDTTRITKPLKENGEVDYVAAVRQMRTEEVTPENNLVVTIYRAMGPSRIFDDEKDAQDFAEQLGIKPLPTESDYYKYPSEVAGIKVLGGFRNKAEEELFEEIWEQYRLAATKPWTADEFPIVAKLLTANEQHIQSVVAHVQKHDNFYSPLVGVSDDQPLLAWWDNFEVTSSLRELAGAISARAMYRLGKGNVDGAWKDTIACFRFSRAASPAISETEELIRSSLDRKAIKCAAAVANHGDLTRAQAQQFLADLASLPEFSNVAECLDQYERWATLQMLARVGRVGEAVLPDLYGVKDSSEYDRIGQLMGALRRKTESWDGVMRKANAFYNKAVEAVRPAKYDDRIAAVTKCRIETNAALRADQITKGDKDELESYIALGLLNMLGPSLETIENIVFLEEVQHMQMDLAKLTIAMSAYHTEHEKYPEKLDLLVPLLIDAVPIDRFTGKPLVYLRKNDGYLFYSLGRNARDDHGLWGRPADDIAVRSPTYPESDK